MGKDCACLFNDCVGALVKAGKQVEVGRTQVLEIFPCMHVCFC